MTWLNNGDWGRLVGSTSRLALVGLLAAGLMTTACDRALLDKKHKEGGGGGGGESITVKAESGYKFSPAKIEVEAGKTISLTLDNTDATEHDWVVEGVDGAKTPTASAKRKVTKSFAVPKNPGTYKVVCSIPGHAEAGMTGELVVKPGH